MIDDGKLATQTANSLMVIGEVSGRKKEAI
jgi:hypothetical protein